MGKKTTIHQAEKSHLMSQNYNPLVYDCSTINPPYTVESVSIKISFQLLSLGCGTPVFKKSVQDLTYTVNVQNLNCNSTIGLKSWLIEKSHSNNNLVYHTSFPSEWLSHCYERSSSYQRLNSEQHHPGKRHIIQSQDMF